LSATIYNAELANAAYRTKLTIALYGQNVLVLNVQTYDKSDNNTDIILTHTTTCKISDYM
jgi:Flp pilus assembly secretin CpaC